MTREEWLCLIQDYLAARVNDAPDEACRELVLYAWESLIRKMESNENAPQS